MIWMMPRTSTILSLRGRRSLLSTKMRTVSYTHLDVYKRQEVFQPKGVYYGLNATTNRMILADRKTLKGPNGVVLGTPGSGKSFSCKREAADVYLHTTDDILFLDPENEYAIGRLN